MLFSHCFVLFFSFFFFFQAEDGIRDVAVTGVQTCALPIWARHAVPLRLEQQFLRALGGLHDGLDQGHAELPLLELEDAVDRAPCGRRDRVLEQGRDRKSTRLNSSHGYISYAVFCLKKKKLYRRLCHTSESTEYSAREGLTNGYPCIQPTTSTISTVALLQQITA